MTTAARTNPCRKVGAVKTTGRVLLEVADIGTKEVANHYIRQSIAVDITRCNRHRNVAGGEVGASKSPQCLLVEQSEFAGGASHRQIEFAIAVEIAEDYILGAVAHRLTVDLEAAVCVLIADRDGVTVEVGRHDIHSSILVDVAQGHRIGGQAYAKVGGRVATVGCLAEDGYAVGADIGHHDIRSGVALSDRTDGYAEGIGLGSHIKACERIIWLADKEMDAVGALTDHHKVIFSIAIHIGHCHIFWGIGADGLIHRRRECPGALVRKDRGVLGLTVGRDQVDRVVTAEFSEGQSQRTSPGASARVGWGIKASKLDGNVVGGQIPSASAGNHQLIVANVTEAEVGETRYTILGRHRGGAGQASSRCRSRSLNHANVAIETGVNRASVEDFHLEGQQASHIRSGREGIAQAQSRHLHGGEVSLQTEH